MSNDVSLNVVERGELEKAEAAIEQGVVAVGEALAKIRDKRLYRETHDTFAAYCKERWGMSDRHARRHIEHRAVVQNIAAPDRTHGSTSAPDEPETPIPSERQARELSRLPDRDQPKAWAEAVEQAGGGKVTAKAVKRVVADMLPEPEHNDEPALDPVEKQKVKPKKNGAERVSAADRKKAYRACGVVIRFLEDIGKLDDYREPMEAIMNEIEPR